MKRTLLVLIILPMAFLLLSACQSANSEQAPPMAESSPASNARAMPEQIINEYAGVASAAEEPATGNQTGSVHYNNPSTGTNADYDLDVDYDGSGNVDRITFPSGGHISEYHITEQTHNGDGTITVITDRGQEFTVDEEEGSDTEQE